MAFFQKLHSYTEDKPIRRKALGVFLVVVGFIALVTPLTPGAWLGIIGLELLGVRLLFLEKAKHHVIRVTKKIRRK